MSNVDPNEVTVVIVPFPAHGHLNQLLHLSLILSTRSALSVHFASSTPHNRQAQLRLHGRPPSSLSSIRFHDLPLPSTPSPAPDPHSPNSFPSHLQPLFDATDLLGSPLSALLLSLSASTRRLVVIHDHLMSFAGSEAAAIPNAESYDFYAPSAAFLCEVESMEGADWGELCSPDFTRFVERRCRDVVGASSGLIINTCREIEGEFLDSLSTRKLYSGKPIFAVGPLNPVPVCQKPNITHDECLEWLDKHPQCSVLYISFGTMSTIYDEQLEQLAFGLHRSRHHFLWVLRDADQADIFAFEGSNRRLPDGFEEAVEGVGKVVRGWVPQLDVLAHQAIGGFISHCGWNSCMEAVSCGVPIIAWPIHSDQPINARLLVEGLKVGVVVRRWDRRHELVMAERLEEVVRMVMEGNEGRRMREKAWEVSGAVRVATIDGGSSKETLDALVAHWRR